MIGKRYKSVLAMVKDLSSPEFAKEFEERLKKETVYVYSNMDDGDVQVFSSLKLAKKWAGGRMGEKIKWEGNALKGVWQYEYAFIHRRKIIRV